MSKEVDSLLKHIINLSYTGSVEDIRGSVTLYLQKHKLGS